MRRSTQWPKAQHSMTLCREIPCRDDTRIMHSVSHGRGWWRPILTAR